MKRISYIIAILALILDQVTKVIVKYNMELHQKITIIEDVFYITSHRNRGAAWGILQNKMVIFYIITVIAIGAFIYFIQTTEDENKFTLIGLGLMLGGAIGNFIDRLFFKEVVDFIDVYIGTYDFPVFNIADSALNIGVAFIIIDMIIEYIKEKKHG